MRWITWVLTLSGGGLKVGIDPSSITILKN